MNKKYYILVIRPDRTERLYFIRRLDTRDHAFPFSIDKKSQALVFNDLRSAQDVIKRIRDTMPESEWMHSPSIRDRQYYILTEEMFNRLEPDAHDEI